MSSVTNQIRGASLNGQWRKDMGADSTLGGAREPTDQPQTGAVPLAGADRTVSVIIACFDVGRVGLLMRAVQSVCDQEYPSQITVVVDYNEELYSQVAKAVPQDVSVVRNTRSRGAAGARNTGALRSDCAFVAFLDDDACAQAGWLRPLVRAMEKPGVVGVGGRILPRWEDERPRWFPPEFGWVVGASIADADGEFFSVRNVWSGSMLVDRRAFQKVGGFREDLSKVGRAARPEDTELCLRLSHVYGSKGRWLMVPNALVEHYVPSYRATLKYVLSRCWAEGSGKVLLRNMVEDRDRALLDEKIYLRTTIPRAFKAGLLHSLRQRRTDGLLQSGTIVLGVAAAMLGATVAGVGSVLNWHARGESA